MNRYDRDACWGEFFASGRGLDDSTTRRQDGFCQVVGSPSRLVQDTKKERIHKMKRLLFCFTFAALAASAQAAPAANVTSAQDALIDTRLNAALLASLTDEAVDTRLNFVIHSLGLSKIDTLTNPGLILLIK